MPFISAPLINDDRADLFLPLLLANSPNKLFRRNLRTRRHPGEGRDQFLLKTGERIPACAGTTSKDLFRSSCRLTGDVRSGSTRCVGLLVAVGVRAF
jgi:hypothetical protein